MLDALLKLLTKDNLATWQAILFILIAFAAGFLAFDLLLVQILPIPLLRLGIYVTLEILIFTLWEHYRKLLPTKSIVLNESLLIVLAIKSEDNKSRLRLETDFLSEFNIQIEVSNVSDLIHVRLAENYQAERLVKTIHSIKEETRLRQFDNPDSIAQKEWTKIHTETKADFYLWGKIYQREDNSSVLDFNGYIDKDLPPHLEKELSENYLAFGVKKRLVEAANETKGFAVEAKFYYLVARYVISIVALYNGKLDVSHRFHKSLEVDFDALEDFEGKEYLVKRLRERLSIEHFLFARQYGELGQIEELNNELETAQNYDQSNASVYLFKAVIEFMARRNVDSALKLIYKARDNSSSGDDAWRYSEAFLFMYKGLHPQALIIYDYIFSHSFIDDSIIVEQVIDFNKAVLRQEPKFIEAHLIIGLMMGKKQGEIESAFAEFNTFLEKAGKTPKYQYLRKAVLKYKGQLEVYN